MRYLLTGDLFSAQAASDMGLVSEVVPDAEVEKRAIDMAGHIGRVLRRSRSNTSRGAALEGMDASSENGTYAGDEGDTATICVRG